MSLIKCRDCGAEFSAAAKACPKCAAPAPKRTGVVSLIFAGLFGLAVFKACSPTDHSAAATDVAQLKALREKQEASIEATKCRRTLDEKKAAYVALLDKKKYWDARLALEDCPDVLHDATLIAMQRGATRLSYLATAGDAKASDADRLRAFAMLDNNFPADAPQFASQRAVIQARADKAEAIRVKKAAAEEKARRRHEGVRLGMTKDEVLGSSWGRPRTINTTTYTFGVHEQWVYDGGYLYFENGILTTIQN